MEFKARYHQDSHYPIEIIVPRMDMSIKEAKELVEKIQAEIEIAEWNEKKESTITNHWSQDYLESFNDDGLSMD